MGSLQQRADHPQWRICAGCGQRMPADQLVRFVLAGDPPRVVPDIRRRAPGRGVHVQPRRACLVGALKRGGFRRGFRTDVRVSVEQLADQACRQYERRIEGLMSAARRARKLAIGTDVVREAVKARQAQLLVVATDATGRREELEGLQASLGGRCLLWGDKAQWGRLCGRSEIAVLAVLDAGIAREVLAAAERVAELAEGK